MKISFDCREYNMLRGLRREAAVIDAIRNNEAYEGNG